LDGVGISELCSLFSLKIPLLIGRRGRLVGKGEVNSDGLIQQIAMPLHAVKAAAMQKGKAIPSVRATEKLETG
jgi:hypothetical protein